jgi:hypothetical protein
LFLFFIGKELEGIHNLNILKGCPKAEFTRYLSNQVNSKEETSFSKEKQVAKPIVSVTEHRMKYRLPYKQIRKEKEKTQLKIY